MKLLKILLAISLASFLGGCAHSINVSPNVSEVEGEYNGLKRMPVSVGYYIPSDLISLEVVTPGGGGDNVRYFPYQDIEKGFERALSNVFSGVVKLPSEPDFSRTKHQGIDYIIQPQLVTGSGSIGTFLWPPTNFTIDLTSNIRDKNGTQIAAPRVVGVGVAETNEFFHEHGIAGQRAMNDALSKMQIVLLDLKLGSLPKMEYSEQVVSPTGSKVVSRLKYLKELKDKNLLTQSEYDAKRKEILDFL